MGDSGEIRFRGRVVWEKGFGGEWETWGGESEMCEENTKILGRKLGALAAGTSLPHEQHPCLRTIIPPTLQYFRAKP